MINYAIEVLLILLLIFTPIAFGSQLLWAFSLMELGILLIIILGAVKVMSDRVSVKSPKGSNQLLVTRPTTDNESLITNNYVLITTVVLSLFLGLVLFQMVPLPEGIVRLISPKTYELRNQLSVITSSTNTQSQFITLSLFPFATKVEFFKWLALAVVFIFLLRWKLSDNRYRIMNHLIIAIFLVGVFQSLYGIFEFFSGHRHILNMEPSSTETTSRAISSWLFR